MFSMMVLSCSRRLTDRVFTGGSRPTAAFVVRNSSSTLNGLGSGGGGSPISSNENQKTRVTTPAYEGSKVKAEMLDLAVDMRTARPGDVINSPYELTISESMQDFWGCCFHSQNRISTSRPFARRIGLQDRILPFSLVLFLTSAMTHADSAKVQVGFGRSVYHWPAFAGDTFTKSFRVHSIRNTSDGNHSIFHILCCLKNQRDRICMSADKRMIFPFIVPESSVVATLDDGETSQLFRDHLLGKASVLAEELGSQSLASLYAGQLICHSMSRSITFSQSQQLASLARLSHPRHFDTLKYDELTEIFVPGGLVLGLTMSASSRDLHEVLHEQIQNVNFINNLHPANVVSAITYVQKVDDNLPGDLEGLTVRTFGIKNLDIAQELDGVSLPLELFEGPPKKPKEIEKICKEKCPILSNKIVVVVDRVILRQSNRQEIFLL